MWRGRNDTGSESQKKEIIAEEYELWHDKLIGHGAFAIVYKGCRIRDRKVVAIKCISKKNLSKCPNLMNKEIKILEKLTELNNKNLVSMYTCQEGPAHLYVIMEFCNGGDLSEYLAIKKTLSEETIRLFLLQLADAMKDLRSLGIVHRDLKPQNILLSFDSKLVSPHPSQITLKIADFGFARTLEDGVMAATLCGSPMYMAPEVIMSLQYDGKADLWSIGTIVYQALTGKAPFSAPSPQALKIFYEKNLNPLPKIPDKTTPELVDFMSGLMKRNPKERMDFDEFFNHKFLQRDQLRRDEYLRGDYPLPLFGSSPIPPILPQKISSPTRIPTPVGSQPESSKIVLSSSPEDDYVIVSKTGHIEQSAESIEKEKPNSLPKLSGSPLNVDCSNLSPPRPSSLPLTTEPIPVPRRNSTQNRRDSENEKKEFAATNGSSSVPRSAPISMKRQENKPETDIDISSLSPPSVKFMIGTPPGGRRRSTSGSSYSETPPPNAWTVSPVSLSRGSNLSRLSNSPIRGTSPPIMSNALSRVPILSSPNLTDNNNLTKTALFSTRAMTLPEISEMSNVKSYYNTDNDHPITFIAPELPEETLLGKEHNETLAKINFVLALCNCILTLAAQKASPIMSLVDSVISNQPVADHKTEQMVLMVRALQLLSSGLTLASNQIQEGILKPSTSVKNVVITLNSKFKNTLSECNKLNRTGILANLKSPECTADAILYHHAVQMCQTAALDELFGRVDDCAERYRTAQILFHSLSQQINCPCDREKIIVYKNAVERRLHVLQEQGVIYATEFS